MNILYVNIAKVLNLYDNPGGRSSHSSKTITGMGIIFPALITIYSIYFPDEIEPYFFLAIIMMATISYLDDLVNVKYSIRFLFQTFALILMAMSLNQSESFDIQLPGMITLVIFGIGVINAFNFMDGINGILGLNSIVILLSLSYINHFSLNEYGNHITFVDNYLIYTCLIGLFGFMFFNFRKKAIGFAGDVGSIIISMIILYLICKLLLVSGDFTYLLLFSVFGIDTSLTVIYKLLLRENIFVPHRDFLFKKLVHIAQYKHLKVAIGYGILQLLINILVIFQPYRFKLFSQLSVLFIVVVSLISIYIIIRSKLTKNRIRITFIKKK
jgi:UDP-N-acetylmuramyl pentapeptide phosphotransferase/UDP-N-acetylglucosamine-1-phosphate transferase